MDNLEAWLKKCEGYNPKPYLDTVGKLTIGWGRCLDSVGISIDEAQLMLDNDIKTATKELEKHSWYLTQPENVKTALINMCFNMGISRLLGFKRMIAALISKDYTKASLEALNSKWANQVGDRARDVALMIRQG
jgi:lysozyme